MKIAVLSGKGGTGKTFISVNLALSLTKGSYIDCDVEEPNGHLFLKPENTVTKKVYVKIPKPVNEKCTGCRECVSFCKFNALIYIKNKLKVFENICHSCGGCSLICKEGAIEETKKEVGVIKTSYFKNLKVVTGMMNTGEESGMPLIASAKEEGYKDSLNTVIDCPPGSACLVSESVSDADICLIVLEPTAFGFSNFKMVYKLCSLYKKKIYVIINKEITPYKPLEEFLEKENLKVVLKIPFDKEIAKLTAEGKPIVLQSKKYEEIFKNLLSFLKEEGLK